MTTKSTPELFRVRVNLIGSDPEIWRLIEIDADLRLEKVHAALQVVMGWEDAHLHVFEDVNPGARWRTGQPEPRRWGPSFLREEDEDLLAEEHYSIRDVLTEERPLFYSYDLGDGWQHCMTLIETLPKSPETTTVTVVRGERRCPLEDSGGIGGYEELLTVIADPADEHYVESAEWVAEMTGEPAHLFDPSAFDETRVNEELRTLFPRPESA